MSAPSQSGPQSDQDATVSRWTCPSEPATHLLKAINRFLLDPRDDRVTDVILSDINDIAAAGPGGKRMLESVRRKRLKRDGGFSCRFVAVKWLTADGQLQKLGHAVPARDLIRFQMARIVEENPETFPTGVAAFFEQECPLLRANCEDFVSLVSRQIHRELRFAAADPPGVTHAQLASILDLMSAYRHVKQIRATAHPRALETIDASDVEKMGDFLIAVAGRLPLTTAEFTRFLELARKDWDSDEEQDIVLRGRIVTVGVDGKSTILPTWITPFVRELASRGLLSRLLARYVSTHRTQRRPDVIRPPGAPTTDDSVLDDDTQVLAASDTAIHYIDGAPQPQHMHVLRNYLRLSTICAVISLDEALRIAHGLPDAPGHRQHVIRLFHDEGWVMKPSRHGEPIFEKPANRHSKESER